MSQRTQGLAVKCAGAGNHTTRHVLCPDAVVDIEARAMHANLTVTTSCRGVDPHWNATTVGVFGGTTAGGTVRKKDDHVVPPELAAKGVTQDAWEHFVFDELPEAMSVLNHCCFEFWCCILTCCISKMVCTQNRASFHEAGRAWEDTFNEYLAPKGCYAKMVSFGYSNGPPSPGDGVVHGLVVAYTPETVEILKNRPRAIGNKSKRYSKPSDFVMFTD